MICGEVAAARVCRICVDVLVPEISMAVAPFGDREIVSPAAVMMPPEVSVWLPM